MSFLFSDRQLQKAAHFMCCKNSKQIQKILSRGGEEPQFIKDLREGKICFEGPEATSFFVETGEIREKARFAMLDEEKWDAKYKLVWNHFAIDEKANKPGLELGLRKWLTRNYRLFKQYLEKEKNHRIEGMTARRATALKTLLVQFPQSDEEKWDAKYKLVWNHFANDEKANKSGLELGLRQWLTHSYWLLKRYLEKNYRVHSKKK
jgi:hypothetical protein